MSSFERNITFYHTITQSRLSMTLCKKPFENIVGKGENASIFSFSYNVSAVSKTKIVILATFFCHLQMLKNLNQSRITFFGRGNPFPNKPWFLRVSNTSLLKTLTEKEKLLVTSNFSFSLSVFFPFGEFFAIFIHFEIVICKLFQF